MHIILRTYNKIKVVIYLTYFHDILYHLSCDFCRAHADVGGDDEDEVECEFCEPC